MSARSVENLQKALLISVQLCLAVWVGGVEEIKLKEIKYKGALIPEIPQSVQCYIK